MNKKTIGKKVRELRKKMGLTTETLAMKVRMSQAQMSRLENGVQGFRAATLLKLAKVLGVPPIYFFVGDDKAHTAKLAEEMEAQGLKPSRRLRQALANAAFLRFIERCAKTFETSEKKLEKMDKAVERVAKW